MTGKRGILIAGLCLIYVAIRVWRLTDACLWFDEIFSIHAAEHSWSSLFGFVAQDLIHPPLFYVLLKAWAGIGGEGVFWLRLFSVVCSSASIYPFISLCRELKLKTSAFLLALLFFAVNGSLIKYAQEVRMYSLLLFLSLVSLWLFSRFFFRGKNIWILTTVNVLLIHTHYFGWLIVIGEVVVIAILQRIKLRHVLIMFGIDLAAFVPWMITIIKAANAGSDVSQNIGWIARPGLRSMFDLVFDMVEPFYYQVSSTEPSTIIQITLPLVVVIAAAKLIYLIEWRKNDGHERFWLLGIITLVPMVIAFAISWISPYSIWGSRHLIVIFAPILMLAAVFLTEISNRIVRYGLLTVAIFLIGAGFVNYAKAESAPQIWCAWERLATDIPTDSPQTIYVFEDLIAYHVWFGTRNDPNISIVKVDGNTEVAEDKAYFLPRGFDGVRRIDLSEMSGDRFWVAFRDVKWNEKHYPMFRLAEQGYAIRYRFNVGGSGMTAFLVEFEKK
ncbi:MAG: glycosyltransferase family 39 protein [Pyrinomonadaceae bacterium]|nr:glycosyltransferase family 39 protein [Blastocatellia bacterium]MCW5957794.1 glycosyltransferase family 39 protein [Pyrinomonadaceae bacterium]